MSAHDDAISIRQMLEYALEAQSMTCSVQRKDLDTDRKLQLSLTRLIEVVGEAANRVSPEAKKLYDAIPW